MRKTMKRVVALTVAAVLGLGMMGCSAGGGGAKSNGKSLMIYAQTNGLGESWLRDAAAAYEKETGTKVNVEFDAYLSTNLTTTLESSATEVGDLYYAATYEWAVWSYQDDMIVDLTDFMNEKGKDGKSLNERLVTKPRYIVDAEGNKKQTIVPVEASMNGLVYNKKMMNYIGKEVLGWEEGHDYPVNTKELRDVIAALEKIQKDGTKKDLFTYKQNGQDMDVEAFVWSGSVGMLEFMTKAWIAQYLGEEGMTDFYNQYENCDLLNHEGFYAAYQEMVDLLDLQEDANGEYYSNTSVPNCVSYNHTASQAQFLMNKAIFCPTGSWFYSEMRETITDLDNVGFMPVPYMSDEKGNPITADGVEMPKDENGNYQAITMQGGSPDYFMIPTRSEKQEEAKDFLRFMFSTDYMPKLLSDMNAPLAFTFDESKAEVNAFYKEVQKAKENSYLYDIWTASKVQAFAKIGFYYNPSSAPFSLLSMSNFGSSKKWIDSATGKTITDPAQATGIAVTENVYNYVSGNYKAARDGWADSLKILGGK